MSFLEEEYLRRLSYKLPYFKQTDKHKWNFRCPICGDSSKKKTKARGYAFDKSGSLVIHCFNCGYGALFGNFLKEIDAQLYQDFILEKFKDRNKRIVEVSMPEPVETKKYVPDIFSDKLVSLVRDLPLTHEARQYAETRKLPVETFNIYYTEDFIQWTKGHTNKFEKVVGDAHGRLLFPFYAKDGHLIGYTARDLSGKQEQKYYRIFIDETEKEKFFGIDRLDETKQVYVLEGEIDSLFLPNAIAVSNGKLDTYYNPDAIYIPDADRRNPHIVRGIEKLLDRGLKVCLLPDGLPGKDINELVVAGFDTTKILDIINKNVYHGLSGKLQFAKWRIV